MRPTLLDLLDRLWREGYTGPLVLQFGQGVATQAEVPRAPERIALHRTPRAALDAPRPPSSL